MNTHNGLIIFSAILSLTIVTVHARHIEIQSQPQKLISSSNNYGQYIVIGSGAKASDLPIVMCDPAVNDSTKYEYDCELHVGMRKRCDLSIDKNDMEVRVKSVYQMSENRVFIELTKKISHHSGPDKILILKVEDCSTKEIDLLPDSTSIAHVGGFYVVTGGTVEQYNSGGNRIDVFEKKVLRYFHVTDFALVKDSQGRDKFFVIEKDETISRLYLVDSEWKSAKLLMNWGKAYYIQHTPFKNHANDGFYAMCWINSEETIECKQYDEFGNTVVNQKIELVGRQRLVGVRNLKGGGLALLSVGYSSKILYLATIQARPPALSIDNYFLTHTSWIQLTEFNEEEKMFKIAYKYSSKDVEPAMFTHKFEL